MSRETESQKPLQKQEKRGIRSAERHASNPFLRGAAVQIKGKKRFYNVLSRSDLIINQETQAVTGGVEHKVVKIVDDAEFVKVFANGVAGIYDLNRAGKRVFAFLLEVVQAHPNVDRIYLHFMDAMEEPWKIPKTTFFNGMAELIEKDFVAPSDRQNMYFLNPCMVWNGDRFRFVQEYIRGESEKRISTSGDAKDRATLEDMGQQRLIE
jgi:hypothetical protein